MTHEKRHYIIPFLAQEKRQERKKARKHELTQNKSEIVLVNSPYLTQ